MKVYVVQGCFDYSDDGSNDVLGVFSSMEKAKNFAKEFRKGEFAMYNYYDISEYEVDEE